MQPLHLFPLVVFGWALAVPNPIGREEIRATLFKCNLKQFGKFALRMAHL